MNERKRLSDRAWLREAKTVFLAMIAEIDMTALNAVNIFFVSRFLGTDGAAAYEVVMPCIMVVAALVALGYNGVQAVCAKDYGARDFAAFERHKNAGYTWMTVAVAAVTLLYALFKAPLLDLLGANDGSENLARLSGECYSAFLFFYLPQCFFSLAACFLFLENRRQLLITNLILFGGILAGNSLVALIRPSMTGFMAMNGISLAAADIYVILYGLFGGAGGARVAATAFNLRFKDFREAFFTGLPDFMEYGFVAILYLIENLYVLSRFSQSLIAGIGVFEAIDNLPEILCVGFCFLVTGTLGTRVGRLLGAAPGRETAEAEKSLAIAAKHLTKGATLGSLAVSAVLLLTARPLVGLFMAGEDAAAMNSAVLLTVSCAIGFVFYMLNSELVCYYKVVGAYVPAHILFFAEALLFPLGFKLMLGELFGVTGFCMGGAAGEIAAFLLNLCIVWRTTGRFPRRLSDFRMDPYLQRAAQKHRNCEVDG